MKKNQFLKKEIFIVDESLFPFAETVLSFTDKILSGGWKITAVHNLQETLLLAGKEVLPIRIIEICKPEYAVELLSEDEYRSYLSMMPCRISIYKTMDDKVYISRKNPVFVASIIGGKLEEVMMKAHNDIEKIVDFFKINDKISF